MTATKSGISAQSIISMHDELSALPAILSGVLDDKIKECKAAMAALDAKQGAIVTITDANAMKSTAAQILSKAQAEAATVSANASSLLSSANEKVLQSQVRERESAQILANLNDERKKFEATRQQTTAQLDAKANSLNTLQSQLANRETVVREREAKVAADQAILTKRLEALKTLA